MKEVDPKALFRLSVLGPLTSRERLARGELQQLIRELGAREYAIPGTRRRHLGEKTIEAWYYAWRRQGLDGLMPKARADRGSSKIAPALQEAILQAKRANLRRSVRQIVRLLEAAGTVRTGSLSRSAVHRLLQQHGLSSCSGSASEPEERRSFSAEFAGSTCNGLTSAGCRHTLLAVSGMEILRQASKGLPRQASRILCTAMRLAVPKGLNHLPDELLQQAIAELQ